MLRKYAKTTFVLTGTVLLSACATHKAYYRKSISQDRLEKAEDVLKTKLRYTKTGLIVIPLEFDFGYQNFIIDTGATRSAIFKGKVDIHSVAEQTTETANVFGLTQSGLFPITEISGIKLADYNIGTLKFAILPRRDEEIDKLDNLDIAGIIGMDLLGRYNLFVDTNDDTVYFIPPKYPLPNTVSAWTPVDLYHNPYSKLDKDLHFFDIRVGAHLMPAILDTGIEFNVISWNATIVPELRRLRRRLQEDWEFQGAIGNFEPTAKVNVVNMKAGLKRWEKSEFIVMTFDHMNAIGFKDRALVIGGIGLFEKRSFYLNFHDNRLWFERPQKAGDVK